MRPRPVPTHSSTATRGPRARVGRHEFACMGNYRETTGAGKAQVVAVAGTSLFRELLPPVRTIEEQRAEETNRARSQLACG
jgi:hypothetical protein